MPVSSSRGCGSVALLMLLAAVCPCLAAETGSASRNDQDVVRLPPFIVTASSPPVVLKLSFRRHMIWCGVKTLTFTSVPPSWAKAGIKVGDHVIAIDNQPLDGMSLMHQFGPLLKAKFHDRTGKQRPAVPFLFAIQSDGSRSTRLIDVILPQEKSLTIYTDGF
jgi:hypothetical protein